jgi:hypothetical protein
VGRIWRSALLRAALSSRHGVRRETFQASVLRENVKSTPAKSRLCGKYGGRMGERVVGHVNLRVLHVIRFIWWKLHKQIYRAITCLYKVGTFEFNERISMNIHVID